MTLQNFKIKFFLLLLVPVIGCADGARTENAGHIRAVLNGITHVLPSVDTDYNAQVAGDLATVTVKQTFRNPLQQSVNATYRFPLNKNASVFEMTMEVGDERIRAKIDRIEKAKSEGKSAALLEEHRPNIFTQSIANLSPNTPITVTLRYVQTVPRVDNAYELVLPLVVGPRYQRPGNTSADVVPPSGPVITNNVDADLNQRVAIRIQLDGSLPITLITSDTHQIDTTAIDDQHKTIELSDNRVVANRDFILRYAMAGAKVNAGVLSHRDARGGFFSLLIEPPEIIDESIVTPREMVFVLDCSGSMDGLPLAASKLFMRKALSELRSTDTFRIIRFSDRATEFSRVPLTATASNIAAGLRYTESLGGGGGTEMTSGIVQALRAPAAPGAIRIVSFLTDGYIGQEAEVLGVLNQYIGDARLFAFGVGAAPNRYLLSEMGQLGRGFTRYLDPTDDADVATTELAERLQSPIFTDIEVDWNGFNPSGLYPTAIPDLFAGDSVRLTGRFKTPGEYVIYLRGRVQGVEVELPVQFNLPAVDTDRRAIPQVWARAAIADHMRRFTLAQSQGEATDMLKETVTRLGLDFNLVTRWTAFIAVSEQIYNTTPESNPNLDVPVSKVAGVSVLAYPDTTVFSGHGAPEPATWIGIFVIGVLALWFLCPGALRSTSIWPMG